MNPVLVSASVLSADFLHLEEDVRKVIASGVDGLHLDVMDGHYVPNLSFGTPLVKALAKISTVPLDAHFMVTNPLEYVDLCRQCGVETMTIHPEVVYHFHSALSQIRQAGMKAGVALTPSTLPSVLEYVRDLVDFVIVMSVNPGFSGQKFIESAPAKIAAVRQMLGERVRIGVDGGVNPQTSLLCRQAGADFMIAATAIFGQEDYAQAIRSLRG